MFLLVVRRLTLVEPDTPSKVRRRKTQEGEREGDTHGVASESSLAGQKQNKKNMTKHEIGRKEETPGTALPCEEETMRKRGGNRNRNNDHRKEGAAEKSKTRREDGSGAREP